MKKILFLIILLMIHNSYATGVSITAEKLGYNTIFKPNEIRTFEFDLEAINDKYSVIKTYVKDLPEERDGTNSNISEYFGLNANSFTLKGKEKAKLIVTMRMPNKIDEPGTHEIRVGAVEAKSGGGMIGAVAAVEVFIRIYVAYDGQYLKASLDASGVNENKDMPVKLSLENLGNTPIKELYSNIKLFNSKNQKVAEVNTEMISLGSQERKVIEKTLDTKTLPPGEYLANATIYHDGKITNSFDKTRVGELKFRITNSTEEILTNRINQVFIETESLWAEPVDNVYAEIIILGREPIRTISQNFGGFEKRRLLGFMDAGGIEEGTYDMSATIHYANKTTTQDLKIKIVKENIRYPGINFGITSILFMIIIVIIIIINATLFVLLMKKKEEYEKNQ